MLSTTQTTLLLTLALTAIEVTGPGGSSQEVRDRLPAATSQIEDRLGPISWRGVLVNVTTTGREGPLNRAPRWAAAYAIPARGTIALRMDRIGSYPHNGLQQVLVHELAHIAIHRRRGAGRVPRWFDEGLSMSIARETGFADLFHTSLALVFGGDFSLEVLDQRFHTTQSDAQAAYALSRSFVRWLEEEFGLDVGSRILELVNRGASFDTAIQRVTGRTLASLESTWMREIAIVYRWLPLATSTATLWLGITLLTVVAYAKVRRRARERALVQELEERLYGNDDEPYVH